MFGLSAALAETLDVNSDVINPSFQCAFQLTLEGLYQLSLELDHLATAPAGQVVVLGGGDRLVGSALVAGGEVMLVDQPGCFEDVERPVNRRQADTTVLLIGQLVKSFGIQVSPFPVEQLNDELALRGETPAGCPDCRAGFF